MGSDPLTRILADLAKTDPSLAQGAEMVFDALTAGEGIDVIDLARVQRFAWFELPVKWIGPQGSHGDILEAGAALFDALDMPRYAEVFRNPMTVEIQDAYKWSQKAGYGAFLKAYEKSGIVPPDLDDFAWSKFMGLSEVAADSAVERALEEAIVDGRMKPGSRGWKTTAADITRGVLDGPRPDFPGQTYRTTIVTERVDFWLREAEKRSPRLYALRSTIVNRLLHPIPAPSDILERVEPIVWFLDRIDRGVTLTQAGYLPTAMVREGYDLYGWGPAWTERAPHGESDSGGLTHVHSLMHQLGAVRPRHRTVVITEKGRRMRDDPDLAWRIVAAGLSGGEWDRAVAEVYTLLILDGVSLNDDLVTRATVILGEWGWRVDEDTTDGRVPPDERSVSYAWHQTYWPLQVLAGAIETGRWPNRATELTDFGRATLLEQIRAEAAGPRSAV